MICLTCTEPLDVEYAQASRSRIHPGCEVAATTTLAAVDAVIRNAAANQPRSLQKLIGPSEIGIPCDRRVGHILMGTPRVRDEEFPWLQVIGTGTHEVLANWFAREEIDRFERDPNAGQRWLVEERVTVGEIGGQPITGSVDLFDAHLGTVVDWKVTSRNKIRNEYRPHGPGSQYRAQKHLYGLGLQNAGYVVRNVTIVFLVRDGRFEDRYEYSEPFDPQIAIDALERANKLHLTASVMGPGELPTASSYCTHCPWFQRGATDLSRACPGHEPAAFADIAGNDLAEFLKEGEHSNG